MGPGADDDLWLTFQIGAWLQECFEGCLVVARSGCLVKVGALPVLACLDISY